jgi:hypothetical protein
MMQDASVFSLPGKPISVPLFSLADHCLDDGDVIGNMLRDTAFFSLPGIQQSSIVYLANSHPDAGDADYGSMLQDASIFFLPGKPISMLTLARSLISPQMMKISRCR